MHRLDTSVVVKTVLIDLSKTYDCLLHDPLVEKLSVYDFGKTVLDLINDYLINHHKSS